jgi:predicted MFS family arabinose efflux permease
LTALAVNRASPTMRPRVSGWLVVAFEFGFRLSPLGLGALITHAGYGAMFMVLALVYLAILLAAQLAARRAPHPAALTV